VHLVGFIINNVLYIKICEKLIANSILNIVHVELMAVQTEVAYRVVSETLYSFTKNLHILYTVLDVFLS